MKTNKTKLFYIVSLFIIMLLNGCVIIHNYAKPNDWAIESTEYYYNMGSELENYILDVVYETDIFDDITPEEQAELDDVYDEDYMSAYYIRLIRLCEKYYGIK